MKEINWSAVILLKEASKGNKSNNFWRHWAWKEFIITANLIDRSITKFSMFEEPEPIKKTVKRAKTQT